MIMLKHFLSSCGFIELDALGGPLLGTLGFKGALGPLEAPAADEQKKPLLAATDHKPFSRHLN